LAHAATDVTGFGFLGHLLEMLDASKVGARIDVASVPLLDGAADLYESGFYPGGSRRNLAAVEHRVEGALTPCPSWRTPRHRAGSWWRCPETPSTGTRCSCRGRHASAW